MKLLAIHLEPDLTIDDEVDPLDETQPDLRNDPVTCRFQPRAG